MNSESIQNSQFWQKYKYEISISIVTLIVVAILGTLYGTDSDFYKLMNADKYLGVGITSGVAGTLLIGSLISSCAKKMKIEAPEPPLQDHEPATLLNVLFRRYPKLANRKARKQSNPKGLYTKSDELKYALTKGFITVKKIGDKDNHTFIERIGKIISKIYGHENELSLFTQLIDIFEECDTAKYEAIGRLYNALYPTEDSLQGTINNILYQCKLEALKVLIRERHPTIDNASSAYYKWDHVTNYYITVLQEFSFSGLSLAQADPVRYNPIHDVSQPALPVAKIKKLFVEKFKLQRISFIIQVQKVINQSKGQFKEELNKISLNRDWHPYLRTQLDGDEIGNLTPKDLKKLQEEYHLDTEDKEYLAQVLDMMNPAVCISFEATKALLIQLGYLNHHGFTETSMSQGQ